MGMLPQKILKSKASNDHFLGGDPERGEGAPAALPSIRHWQTERPKTAIDDFSTIRVPA